MRTQYLAEDQTMVQPKLPVLSKRSRRWPNVWQVFRVVLAGVALIAPAFVFAVQDPAENPTAACSREHLKNVASVGQLVFKSYKNDYDGSCLEVIQDAKVIFRRTIDSPQGYTLGQAANKEWKVPAIANGTDITGRGHPNMIVSFYTGGAHCCTFHYIFELKPEFKLLATLNAADTWPAYFADLDNNHRYYYLAADWTFAYWCGAFAGSPNHSIILRYVNDSKGAGFHLAMDKMQTPAPSPKEWQKALRNVRSELRLKRDNMYNELPTYLWQEVLKLIYTGHSDLAWKFLEEAGPEAQQAEYPDLADFCSQLKTSPYWSDLAATLKNTPPACANAKPQHR